MSDVTIIKPKSRKDISEIYYNWIHKEKGPTISQRMEIAANAFLGGPGTDYLGKLWKAFAIGVDEFGNRHVLKVTDDCVVSYASEKWLSSTVHQTLHRAVEQGASSIFLFSENSIQGITKQIINLAKEIQIDKIAPVSFKSHSHFTWRQVPFDPTDMKTPTFDYIFSRVDSEISVNALKCLIGAAFDKNYTPQNYAWLYGPGGDGKGTLLKVLSDIFGNAVGPVDNFLDKYWTSGLVGKRIAINPDVACPKIVLSGIFKAVTGGGQVQIRPMREKPYYGTVNTILFLAANEPPQVKLNAADRRRLILVKFNDENPKHIDDFENKIKNETPGFILECITAWGIHQFKVGKKIELDTQELDELAEENSCDYQPIFDLCFRVDETSFVNSFEFRKILEERESNFKKRREFSDFKKWCEFKKYFEYKNIRVKGKQGKHYLGIALR